MVMSMLKLRVLSELSKLDTGTLSPLVIGLPELEAEDHSIPAIEQGYVEPNYERPRNLRIERILSANPYHVPARIQYGL